MGSSQWWQEEFSIVLPSSRLVYKRKVVNVKQTGFSYFFAAYGTQEEVESIVFGDEGECWSWMRANDYVSHTHGIHRLQQSVGEYLAFRLAQQQRFHLKKKRT